MIFSDIEQEWAVDSRIDQANLLGELTNIAYLHGKYFRFLNSERSKLSKLESSKKKLLRLKRIYYAGRMSKEECDQLGYPLFQLKLSTAKEIEIFIDGDDEMIELDELIKECEERIQYLTSIITIVNSRGYHINTLVEYEKFRAGLN